MVLFNCDMGEGMLYEEAIMPLIDAANISCGYHAGDEDSIKRSVSLAIKHQVKIGAHPSFADKENFGRKEINLTGGQVYELVSEQLFLFKKLVSAEGASLHHVKPHGALYNMAAREPSIALCIAKAVHDLQKDLVVFGLSGSMGNEALLSNGFPVLHETFCDRNYNADGSLMPRNLHNALIESPELCIKQLKMLLLGYVNLPGGDKLYLKSDTICIHGDGKNALTLAKAIRNHLDQIS